MITLVIILSAVFLFIFMVMIFIRQEKFGRLPSGARMERIRRSPNYKGGQFLNAEVTPALTEGVTYPKLLRTFFFSRNPRRKPAQPMPTRKTGLHHIDPSKNTLVWFGHSSYFMRVDSLNILVDPVLSGAASPVRFTTRSFEGSNIYSVSDLPSIDILFLTHDHWDHLDHDTLLELKSKVKKIVTSLGVGAHLGRWGFHDESISEMDWNEELKPLPGVTVNSITARHFSGRGFKRAQSIWSSFVLRTPTKTIFIGGDSGYGEHFKRTGEAFGPFDLALLECGQYNAFWKYIHMTPEETAQAATELHAKNFMAVHWGKFALAMHDWDEPIRRVTAAARSGAPLLLSPMIGEAVDLDHPAAFPHWWEKLK